MIIPTDTRRILNGLFRQGWKFILVFVPLFSCGILYVFTATPQYQSTVKLLVKFNQEARPTVSNQPAAGEGSSADEHHELVQSNVNILTSRDLAETLLNDVGVAHAYPKLAQNPPVRGTLMDAAVKQFTGDLIVKTESESDIINVGLYNPDPQTAKLMLSKLIDLFVARQSEIYANPQTTALHEQAQTAHTSLEDAQKRLYEYKSKTGIVSIEEELTLLLRQRSDLSEELLSKERSYAHYRSDPSSNRELDPDTQALKKQLKTLDLQIAETAQRKAHYDDLARENEIDADNYKAAEMRAQEAQANQGLNQEKITRISVVEQPTLPYTPSKPWKAMILVFSLLAGLLLGFAVCIIAEILNQSFSFPEQAAAALNLPLLASFSFNLAHKKEPKRVHIISNAKGAV